MTDLFNGIYNVATAPLRLAESVGFVKGAAYGSAATALLFVSAAVFVHILNRSRRTP